MRCCSPAAFACRRRRRRTGLRQASGFSRLRWLAGKERGETLLSHLSSSASHGRLQLLSLLDTLLLTDVHHHKKLERRRAELAASQATSILRLNSPLSHPRWLHRCNLTPTSCRPDRSNEESSEEETGKYRPSRHLNGLQRFPVSPALSRGIIPYQRHQLEHSNETISHPTVSGMLY